MKSWKIALPAVALTALVAGTALGAGSTGSNGSSAGKWTFGINGGSSIPMGDFGDAANSGWNIGGQADFWKSSMLGFGADVSYHDNAGNDDANAAAVITNGTGSEVKFNNLEYGAHVVYLLSMGNPSMSPFLQGGVAGYNVKTKIDGGTLSEDESENKFGFNLGAGLDFNATQMMMLGVGATYHYVTTDPSINWFGINARVTLKMASK